MNYKRRIRQRGFTLVELMVSLIAGLFVAMAVVSLATQATNTFHEEARTANSEMSLRTAVERLRADLQRSAYMSSGNYQADPFLATAPGATRPKTGTFNSLYKLAGIHLLSQGSLALTPLSANNGLAPDAIELAGNYTTTDDYVVRYMDAGGACGGTRLWLAADSPAMWRILSQTNPDASLEAAFQPVAGSAFLARIADDTGHFQYIPTCTGKTAGLSGTGTGIGATPYVDLNTASIPILTAQSTGTNGGVTGLGVGRLRVNPVQTVKWEVRPLDSALTGDGPYMSLAAPATGDASTGDKYELFRTFVDASGTVTQQPELVAEYAVDLKFAFSADKTAPGLAARTLTVYALSDDTNNATLADDITTNALTQPQRIRSVHFRLSTRSAVADRSFAYTVPVPNPQQPVYPTRYCVLQACTAGQTGWARVRSITSEVTTPNLAKYFY
jgi:prepilin-type N-terminal cleavage/methylation domain-containing protein